MTLHITFPALDPAAPATVSPAVLGGLLRGDLSFDGVVISDDLEIAGIALKAPLLHGALAALRAGCDILIASRMLLPQRDLPGLLAGLRRAIGGREIPPEQVAAELLRTRRLREGLAWRLDPAAARTVLRAPAHLALLDAVHGRAGA